MSNDFQKKFGTNDVKKEDMRKWCQRPGKVDKEGKILYFTEQVHKRECDVNYIIRKFDKQGLITHVSKIKGKFGDMTANDFTSMQNKIANSINMFNELPSEIRNKFDNAPAELLRFMENPDNREKAIEMGLIDRSWTEATDGIGEQIPDDGHQKKDEPEPDPETKGTTPA